jgi:hypothetical protein
MINRTKWLGLCLGVILLVTGSVSVSAFSDGADLKSEVEGNVFGESEQVIYVYSDGTGDYTRLSDAMASIADASASKPYTIVVVGKITDTTQIVAKSYVDVIGYAADVTVQSDAAIDGLRTEDITHSQWRNITIRRVGSFSGYFALGMYGSADKSVRFENCRFINDGAGCGCKGAYIRDNVEAVFDNCYFRGSHDATGWGGGTCTSGAAKPTFNACIFIGGDANHCTGFEMIMNSAPRFNDCQFYGGGGSEWCFGFRTEDMAAPIVSGGVAYGGNGGTSCRAVQIVFASAPVINGLTVHQGSGGEGCFGIYVGDEASPVISGVLVTPEELPKEEWHYSSANNGRFRPFAGKPYMLTTILVWVQTTAPPGTTLDLGITPGGDEIASGIALDSPPVRTPVFPNRVEIADDGYMYATPSQPIAEESFHIYYTVVTNYPGCRALVVEPRGFPLISNSTFVSNGASDALYIENQRTVSQNWKVSNCHLETLDPVNQRAVNAGVAITDAPIYNCTFVGTLNNIASFAGADHVELAEPRPEEPKHDGGIEIPGKAIPLGLEHLDVFVAALALTLAVVAIIMAYSKGKGEHKGG